MGFALLLLALSVIAGARAQDAPQPQQTPAAAPSGQKSGGGRGANTPASPAAAEQHRLPPDATTKHTLALPGRTLNFTATAGSIRLFDGKGEPQADIAYTAYQLDGADAHTRPVTFLFNGGPGAASAWLQFGAAGPWRLPINADAVTSSASPDLDAQCRDLARLHRPRLHRSRRHRLQPLRRDRGRCAQEILLGRRRRHFDRD